MPNQAEGSDRILEEFRAYLETLSFIQVDPRLLSKFGMSDIIQKTLLEAWRDLVQLETMDANDRKRRLRKMLVNNLLDEIAHWRGPEHDVNREQPLDAAVEESSCRLKNWLAIEETPPAERLVQQEQGLRLLDALSKLDPREREALVLQKYHGLKLAEIAEHLGCTIGAVAGLHARGLQKLRKQLTAMGVTNA